MAIEKGCRGRVDWSSTCGFNRIRIVWDVVRRAVAELLTEYFREWSGDSFFVQALFLVPSSKPTHKFSQYNFGLLNVLTELTA